MDIICIYIVSLTTEKIQNWEFLNFFLLLLIREMLIKKGFKV